MSAQRKLISLDALKERMLANTQSHQASQAEVQMDAERRMVKIRVDDCVPSPFQHRRRFDQDEIASLAATIEEAGGLIEPIIVRAIADGKYEIVAGERRWRAHRHLGWAVIDAVVRDLDDVASTRTGALENIQRKALSDYETYLAVRDLDADPLYKTRANLSRHLSMSRQDMYRYFAFQVMPQFMIDDLEADPRLVSRKTVDLLRRYVTEDSEYPKEVVLETLKELWENVKRKKLDQGKLPEALEQKLKSQSHEKPRRVAKMSEIVRNGKVVGKFERTSKFVLMRVQCDQVDIETQQKLEDYLSQLLNG